MHDRKCLLAELLIHFREGQSAFAWDDGVFLRSCLVRLEKNDATGWSDFDQRVRSDERFQTIVWEHLRWESVSSVNQKWNFATDSADGHWERTLTPRSQRLWARLSESGATAAKQLLEEIEEIRQAREEDLETPVSLPGRPRTAVMYIEEKYGARGEGRIGRVSFSHTQKTLYYGGRRFQSMKGQGWLANYYDLETREWFWISRCRKDGLDALYPAVIEIDDDVRHEYWTTIRNRPEMVHRTTFRSEGKYSRRRPR